jgi:hypothetical protein
MVTVANAVRSIVSTTLMIVGVLILVFGVLIAYGANAITIPSVVYFLFGAVLIAASGWI